MFKIEIKHNYLQRVEVTTSEIERLCNVHTSRALSQGKLFLILNLNNTLLETISTSSLTLKELNMGCGLSNYHGIIEFVM